MTAIACWMNKESAESVWAVSDSRITQQNSPLTNHCPKLFSISVSVIRSADILRIRPQKIFEFGFGFAGSTMIGINVKEMLAVSLSQLHEIGNGNPEHELPSETYPSLYDIALLTKNIAEKYMHDLGQFFPKSVKTEIVIFGYCKKTQSHKIIKLNNSPSHQATLNIEDCQGISSGNPVLLGDHLDEFNQHIQSTKLRFTPNTINWWRAPFIALNNWINHNSVDTIGGYIQLSIASMLGAKILFLTDIQSDSIEMSHAGINITESFSSTLGGFILMPMTGMSLPNEDGWDSGSHIAT
ncbi:hypothetical protein PROVRETT_05759 [Providencia rettgeri DSM 1131]|uniref:hypothetical protein n=2 Tax=Providencia TaxID=586 RepID=UPI000197C2B2|nr:hypothetical protein [Providencia rettgeri]EFE55470.1 hypothetical protein PROVRETT_05759 [Providencia rettgeri DSM 1131]